MKNKAYLFIVLVSISVLSGNIFMAAKANAGGYWGDCDVLNYTPYYSAGRIMGRGKMTCYLVRSDTIAYYVQSHVQQRTVFLGQEQWVTTYSGAPTTGSIWKSAGSQFSVTDVASTPCRLTSSLHSYRVATRIVTSAGGYVWDKTYYGPARGTSYCSVM